MKPWLSPRDLLSYYIIAVIILLIAVIILSHARMYLLNSREVSHILHHAFLLTKAPGLARLPHPLRLWSLEASPCCLKLFCAVVSEKTESPFQDISVTPGTQALGNKV